MTVLAIIDIALTLVAAGLWGGYWWMIRTFPEVPLLERFPIHTVRQQVQQAPYFNLYASATSTVLFSAEHKARVVNGILYPDGR